ncbi:hypothetical protein [Aliiroseovarius sp. PrR006]|uniref:hypothetical protein n=1 Tax=Aliiroseovarius sp. PrR006 TaxID=2706883 RepID=UPI0013D39E39|nr:hypothetical protein [Aliiroseovarius sp. PrR006]NDW52929.1 hypothetical protein [Aliiroseovarius sp. PrR006]
MRNFIFVAALSVLPSVATADPLEDIRESVAAQDVEAVSQYMLQMHKTAEADGNFTPLQRVNGKVFSSTDPKVISFLKKWLEEDPENLYALTAWAWNRHEVAFAYRGFKNMRQSSPYAIEAYRQENDAARTAAQMAYALDPKYVPAADAMITMHPGRGAAVDIDKILADIMEVSPNYQSLSNAIWASSPNWGGSFNSMSQKCVKYADRIPDYSQDICLTKAALEFNVPSEMRKTALKVLSESDHPRLLSKYADSYNYIGFPKPIDVDRLIEKHRKALSTNPNAEQYLISAEYFSINFGRSEYYFEARDALRENILTRVKANPYDPHLIKDYLQLELKIKTDMRRLAGRPKPVWDDSMLLALQKHWVNALEFGQFDPAIWALGASLLDITDPRDDNDRIVAFLSQAISLSPEPQQFLGQLMNHHYYTWRDAASALKSNSDTIEGDAQFDIMKDAQCPMYGAARLFATFCEFQPGNQYCNPVLMYPGTAEKILSDGEVITACSFEAEADIQDVYLKYFNPVPTEDFLAKHMPHLAHPDEETAAD